MDNLTKEEALSYNEAIDVLTAELRKSNSPDSIYYGW